MVARGMKTHGQNIFVGFDFNFAGNGYHMEYTSLHRTRIVHDINHLYYLFHRSPDITVRKKVKEEEIQSVVVQQSSAGFTKSDSDGESSTSDFAALENSTACEL